VNCIRFIVSAVGNILIKNLNEVSLAVRSLQKIHVPLVPFFVMLLTGFILFLRFSLNITFVTANRTKLNCARFGDNLIAVSSSVSHFVH
jgi:hypothetical protein